MGGVLILVLVEDGLGGSAQGAVSKNVTEVLILVLVEDGLGDTKNNSFINIILCLNPCFSGGWSRRIEFIIHTLLLY